MMSYVYYHGIIDHSGINFKRKWWQVGVKVFLYFLHKYLSSTLTQPWQPDCIFHDNHHQYFHVNFGFNIEYWDKLHGTYRRKDRIYREDIYYGQGKSLGEASLDEIKSEIEERESENPLAYPENKYGYDMELDGSKVN